ncbi:T9SS type B sorting domain-containing protein [Cognatitamlana onchidii]|uniref:T9SS type B sorting domain-containing protein n=1 Tax=Cognatitamlana onchidii TaxID=2562860 RepID=UPI0010A659B7|nr:choice-of-anchor L domain-containing protein [Algibacter onchidii]
MKYVYYIICILFCCGNYLYSQQISIDDTVDVQSLIEDNLVDGCVNISNITSSINGNSYGFPSYGFFEKASSNFPFEKGIVISTGGAASGGNPQKTPILSEGSSSWGSDPDLEAALGTTDNYVNATSIEFDFVSISNLFQFNYLLASEEYFEINPCQFSDGFVFLIKRAGTTDPYQNIALIPGTNIPVNTNTIHNEIFGVCEAQNEEYFEGYGLGDTNYNGRTTVLTASGSIEPNVTYHIKIIIADQKDSLSGGYDSAVFIEGDSFRTLDLGKDISTCAGSALLNADIDNNLASYAWFRNNTIIPGATGASFNATQNGVYKVEVSVPVNGTNCVEEDEINVELSTEESMGSVTDFLLCDDPSGNVFNLSSKDDEISNADIPFTNFSISYHNSIEDAKADLAPISSPVENPTSPKEIFVRVQDNDSACFALTSFNLIVNTQPNITNPTPLNICDSDDTPDGITVVDPTQRNEQITNGNPELFVTYHQNSVDVSTGDNPVTAYINTSRNELLYVRVINTVTGCVATTTLNVSTEISPIVNRDTQFINACDNDMDGNAFFDLTEVITPILNGLTGVSTSFHISYEDALSDINAIVDPSNYEYTNAVTEPGSATLFLRIKDDLSDCSSIIPFEIHTNLLLTATDTGDFALCDDDEDSTNSIDFDLFAIEKSIANELSTANGLPNNIEVTFYRTEENRDAGTSPLNKNLPFSALDNQVVYISIDDGECTDNTQITLIINPILQFPEVTIPYCDDNDDGLASIDLQSLDSQITSGDPNFEVTYFENAIDADNNVKQLPQFYANTLPEETLYARITSPGTPCYTVNPFKIKILTAPTASMPSDIAICDNYDGTVDGFAEVNLNAKISEMVTSTTGLDIDFFTSLEDANNKTNEIPETQRANYNTDTKTIYTRIEDIVSGTGCYAIVPFEIFINIQPVIPSGIRYQICKNDGTDVAYFILSEKDEEILDGQSGKEVLYFEDSGFTIPIDKSDLYQNKLREQTIYIRVQNITDSSCFETGTIELRVSPSPIYNPVVDFLICDDTSNDGKHVFDLEEKANELRAGLSGDDLNISFHKTFDDADNNRNALNNSYTNTANPETIYIRIENDNSLCHIVESLGINIISAPGIIVGSPSITSCAKDYSGMAEFDLTVYNLLTSTPEFEITDRVISNLEIHYFNNVSDINYNDGLDNSNAISTPSNFLSESKTIYIKVTNTLTRCFSLAPLELISNPPPNFNPIGTIEICDNESSTYNLQLVNDRLVNDTSLVNISFHDTPEDANNNTPSLDNIFIYTNSSHLIYIRISNINTGCYITTNFTLQINSNPIANTPPNLITCDDDFDGIFNFDLNNNSSFVLGTQNASQFTVTYYETLDDAEQSVNAVTNYPGRNNDVIYARIENNDTGCYNTTLFNLIVHPLPIIPINDNVPLCDDQPISINAYTGNPNDTYLWSTNVNPSENNSTSSEIYVTPNELGAYSVTVTTPNNCSYTKNFTVIESEQAEITFTSTVDFVDPNSITVDINLSRIGDYVYILDDGDPQVSNVFENVSFGNHVVTVRDLNGCMDVSKDVFVFDIPKFLTPNADGYYDTWHVIGASQLPGTIVYIYDRYGKLLKTLPYNASGWNGTYNGENMPSDDYWFIANIVQNGNTSEIKGHFTLKR